MWNIFADVITNLTIILIAKKCWPQHFFNFWKKLVCLNDILSIYSRYFNRNFNIEISWERSHIMPAITYNFWTPSPYFSNFYCFHSVWTMVCPQQPPPASTTGVICELISLIRKWLADTFLIILIAFIMQVPKRLKY